MELFDDNQNIQRWVTRLDQVAVDYESRWGVGRLENLVSPDMREKWDRQKQKLDEAIQAKNLTETKNLVEGTIRGYAALEKQALELGHKFQSPDMWEVKHPENDTVFRIVKNNFDYDMACNGEAHVFTLQEIARILSAHAVINEVKNVFPDSQVVGMSNEFKEDNLPF